MTDGQEIDARAQVGARVCLASVSYLHGALGDNVPREVYRLRSGRGSVWGAATEPLQILSSWKQHIPVPLQSLLLLEPSQRTEPETITDACAGVRLPHHPHWSLLPH